jgi:hypothetical protein
VGIEEEEHWGAGWEGGEEVVGAAVIAAEPPIAE